LSESRVILTISPSNLDVTVIGGRGSAQTRRRWFDRSDWPANWTAAIDEYRKPLAEMVTELDAAGLEATIVFASPATFVTVGACPGAAGKASALQAARLALSSLATFPMDTNPHDVRILHADAGGTTPAENARIHTIAAADTDEHITTLTRLATAVGLRAAATVPAEGLLTVAAIGQALAEGPVSATLCVGEHQTVLAVGGAGRLDLVRTIAAGTETLVEALVRPIRAQGGGETITLSREAARRLLTTVGIPSSKQELPGLAGCDGASVLPLLQPVLQRIAIEIKQSLRFGLDETTRAGIRLRVIGAGAGIANLDDLLSRQAGIGCDTASSKVAPEDLSAIAFHRHDLLPTLLSNESSDQATVRGLRRALIAGVGAAAALLAIEGVSVYMSLAEEKNRLSAINSNVAGSAALADQQQRAVQARVLTTALNSRVQSTLGDGPAWSAVLDTIASRTPTSMRLLDVAITPGATGTICNLRGYVRLDKDTDAAGEIRKLVEGLGREPVVESVKLGVTQRANIRGRDSQTFELAITLVPVPAVQASTSAPAVDPTREGEP
jgi:hypothetical protein